MKSMTKLIVFGIAAALLFMVPVTSAQTAGMRHNNPGNIVCDSRFEWIGQTGCASIPEGNYVVFEHRHQGTRAIFHLLWNYHHQHGIDTIKGVMTRWSENPLAALEVVRIINGWSGEKLSVHEPFGSHDMNYYVLAMAIIALENGQEVITQEFVEESKMTFLAWIEIRDQSVSGPSLIQAADLATNPDPSR